MRGVRVPQDNLEQNGRGLSAPGSQQANAEEMLAELVRLVKSSGLAPKRRPPPVEDCAGAKLARQGAGATARSDVAGPADRGAFAPTERNGARRRRADPGDPIRRFPFERSERDRFGGWTTFRALDVQSFGARARRRGGGRRDLLAGTDKVRAAQGAAPALRRAEIQPWRRRAPIRASRLRARPARPRDSAAGRGQDCQSRTMANRPERARVARKSAAVSRPWADSRRRGAAGGPACRKAACGAGRYARGGGSRSRPLHRRRRNRLKRLRPPFRFRPSRPRSRRQPPPAPRWAGRPASDAPLPPVRPAPKATVQASGAAQRPTPKLESPTKLSGPSGAHAAAKAWSDRPRGSPVAASAWGVGEPREQGGASLGRTAGGPTGATGAGSQAAKRQSCGARLRHRGGRGRRGGRPHSVRTPLMVASVP